MRKLKPQVPPLPEIPESHAGTLGSVYLHEASRQPLSRCLHFLSTCCCSVQEAAGSLSFMRAFCEEGRAARQLQRKQELSTALQEANLSNVVPFALMFPFRPHTNVEASGAGLWPHQSLKHGRCSQRRMHG